MVNYALLERLLKMTPEEAKESAKQSELLENMRQKAVKAKIESQYGDAGDYKDACELRNKTRKTVKLKSIPKHIDELIEITEKPIKQVKLKKMPKKLLELMEITEKPIKLRKTINLKSDKKIVQDIDKLLKEVDTIIKKQKKGSLTITQVRSEIFNRILKEADKQHNAGELSDNEYIMVVTKLNEGDLKTAESYLMGPSQIKEIDKLIKQLPKGQLKMKTPKATKTKAKAMLAEEREPHDDEYLMSLPKTKKGLISRSSKEFKALTAEEKERAFSLSNKPRTEAKKTKQAEARAKLTARNKADKQSGQSKIINSGKTLEEAKAYIEAKKKALEEKKKAEASKPSAIKETEAKLKTDLRDFAMAIRRLPEISAISKLTDAERYSAKNALSDAFSNKRVVSETIKQIKHNKSLPEERILELMDVYDAVQNIELLKKYKELI